MFKKGILWGLLFLLGACAKTNQTQQQKEGISQIITDKVIYGDDDRKDLYQVTDSRLLHLADSTVALIKKGDLQDTGSGSVKILGSTFASQYNLCSEEPFREQELAAFCSGSLVAPNLIITAGHCIESAFDCANARFVFGYSIKVAGILPQSVNSQEVYACKKIIKQVRENTGADFAVIELDREVVGHSPLAVRRQSVANVGDSLTVIGHPTGLPTKVAGGGRVRSVTATHYVTDLDTYGGNSGSAVFNSDTGEIEGILVRGEMDFITQDSCTVSNRCSQTDCRGEDVTRIDLVVPYLPSPQSPTPNPQPNPQPQPPARVEYGVQSQLSIPDNVKEGIISSFDLSDSPKNRSVKVYVNISHTFIGDLVLTLIAPNGKSYILQSHRGGRTRDLVGTFGDNLVASQSLNDLSKSGPGMWQLKVTDTVQRDFGVLNSWKLIFE